MALWFVTAHLSVPKDTESVAGIQAWAASSLEDHIHIQMGLAQSTMVVAQHPPCAANKKINQAKQGTDLLRGELGMDFAPCPLMAISCRMIFDSSLFLALQPERKHTEGCEEAAMFGTFHPGGNVADALLCLEDQPWPHHGCSGCSFTPEQSWGALI